MARGGVRLAVSFDISNAFNTLPREAIMRGLARHRVPAYLVEVIGDYLRDRWIDYPGRYGEGIRRAVVRGVPQGSVLGPLLWSLAYDSLLRASTPTGVSVTCYADDTLLLATARSWRRARLLGEVWSEFVVGRIRSLGLEVAAEKTEAMWFHSPRRGCRPPEGTVLRIGEASVRVGYRMKYLGLTLDSSWSFNAHFESLAPRIGRVSAALGRLLPNLGGPGGSVRRLYAGVVRSIALYGAPVWAGDLAASARGQRTLRRCMRAVAIRIARGYRTISYETAGILAGELPIELLAEAHAWVYKRRHDIRREEGALPEPRRVEALKLQARRRALLEWRDRLAARRSGRVVGAILPCLEAWLDREHGGLSYRLTQVLTGHGCFGEYLCRIGKETTANCHHCGEDRDTAQHTLEHCSAWADERCVLVLAVGEDLSLPTVVRKMVESERSWEAVASFCERVMLAKEAAERERERDALQASLSSSSTSEEDLGERSPQPQRRRWARAPRAPP